MGGILRKLQHLIYALILLSVSQATYADTRVRVIQQRLVELGYNPGIVDGVWGSNTHAALSHFLTSKGQTFDGKIDENELQILGIISDHNNWLTFNFNVDDSLPNDWIYEFETIIYILQDLLPIGADINVALENSTMDIYAWNGRQRDPFGRGMKGACICGDGITRWMVLEIPEQELRGRDLHRYSVIVHEYFHIYQIGLSRDRMQPKWLVEGGAKVIEEMFVQQYYGRNSLRNDLNRRELWSDEVFTDPWMFESYTTSSAQSENGAVDGNYAGSAFMLLALVNELQRNNISEVEAFRLVFRDFWISNSSETNWKAAFEETFGMSVEEFYILMSDYSRRDVREIMPSSSLKLEDIFS